MQRKSKRGKKDYTKQKKQRGGSCSTVSGVSVPCNQTVDIDAHKIIPINLSQSENAFEVRYQTGGRRRKSPKPHKRQSPKSKGQRGGGYYLAVEKAPIAGLTEVIAVADHLPPVAAPGPFAEYPKPSYVQAGGAYKSIRNPLTNRNVKVNSTLGRKIVRKYVETCESCGH
jgi:hypothetical protein